MKFRRRSANALFDLGRTRELEQPFLLNAGSRRSDLGGDFSLADLFPFAQRGIGQRETNAIISETKVPGCLGRAIRGEPFWQTGIVPIGIEHERRTHHHSAASIEPLLLLSRSGQTTRIHQRDLPLKLDAAIIKLLQFRPCWLGPETPG